MTQNNWSDIKTSKTKVDIILAHNLPYTFCTWLKVKLPSDNTGIFSCPAPIKMQGKCSISQCGVSAIYRGTVWDTCSAYRGKSW